MRSRAMQTQLPQPPSIHRAEKTPSILFAHSNARDDVAALINSIQMESRKAIGRRKGPHSKTALLVNGLRPELAIFGGKAHSDELIPFCRCPISGELCGKPQFVDLRLAGNQPQRGPHEDLETNVGARRVSRKAEKKCLS